MFEISNNPKNTITNKVIFVKNKNLLKKPNKFININDIDTLKAYSERIKQNDVTLIEYNKNNSLQKIIVVNEKDYSKPFEFQNLGGKVHSLNKSGKLNILLDTLSQKKDDFISNFLLGIMSKSYDFDNFKTDKKSLEKKQKKISYSIFSSNKKNVVKCLNYADSIYKGLTLTRNLVTTPANILNPYNFTKQISVLAKDGLKVEILNENQLKKLGMNALLGVGQGSANKSYVAIMSWKGSKKKNDKPLAFIGKGVCFDTGGISLKPAKFMEEMKYDMAGAGTVVGLMKTLAKRKAKINAVGVVGLVENMADGNAQRPGDVVKSYSGKTIEIFNTDAEGRLVLADILSYTEKRFNPKFMINLATLTGAIIIALGNEYAGLFSNNDKLSDQLYKSGKIDNEKVWRLPLSKEFDKLMNSQIADVQNINYAGGAQSITAAQFLQRFVLKGTPWAHLDIAGMAWTKKSNDITPSGATGYGVKLLNRLVHEFYE